MKGKRMLIEALCGFVFWTLFLTPYMVFVTKMSLEQYISWIGMQLILVPPISIVVMYLTNKVLEKANNE